MKRSLLLAAFSTFLLTPCFPQAPAVSRDVQRLPISVDECTRTGTRTLERAGYQISDSGNDWVTAVRDIHRALILCSTAPDGSWANVIVTSNTQEFALPGREQHMLMYRFANMARNRDFDDREWDRDRDRDHDGDRARDGDRGDRDHDRDRAHWLSVASQQPLPGNAVPGGREPNHPIPQFVCRADHEGNLIPGKTVTTGSSDCYIPYQGIEVRKLAFDVLTGDADDYVWAPPNAPRPALYTGTEAGAKLRSCRFELRLRNQDRGVQLGKEAGGKCMVSYKGGVYTSDRYEVLYASR